MTAFQCGDFVKACNLPNYSNEKKWYIDSAFETYPDEIMYTQALRDLLMDLGGGHLDFHLSGPKGCGKSVILASLFYIFSLKDCVYLTPWSFSCFKQVEMLYGRRKSSENELMYVNRLMVSRKYLLLDLGYRVIDYDSMNFLIRLWNPPTQKFAKVVALSSGYVLTYKNPGISYELSKLCNQIILREYETFNKVTITGFTNEEADKYITNRVSLERDAVKELGGTNPFLLKLAVGCSTFQEYEDRVNDQVEFYLRTNLWIFEEDDSIAKYFAKQEWDIGREYLFLILEDMEFTSDQLLGFKKSWLHKSQLTIDVDEKRKRFNFPSVGNLLVPLLRKFCDKFARLMQNLAAKNPSVAGYANEEFFITYLKQNVSIPVVVSSITSVESQSIALFLGTCVPFKGANYIKGIMYELYIFHPAIDFVGYLDANNSSCGFLVMLQLSLSRYADHQKKLSDVIRHAPKKSYLLQGETTAPNLLTHYSSRGTDLFGPKNPMNVIICKKYWF